MNVCIIIYSNDPETVWNAFRLGNACHAHDEEVSIFLLGKGVESSSLNSLKYNIKEQRQIFEEHGGKVIGCGVCCDNRQDVMPFIKEDINCDMGSMQDLYTLIKDADKVVTF